MKRKAETRWLLVVFPVLVFLLAAMDSTAQENAVTNSHALRIDGYLSDEPNKIVLKDAIAFWSSEGHQLSVVCYPFVLSQEDVDALRRQPADAVTLGRHDKQRNPDSERWRRTPLILLKLCFDPHKELTVDNLSTNCVEVWFGGLFPISASTDRQLGSAGITRSVGQTKNHVTSLALTQENDQMVLDAVVAGSSVYRDEYKKWEIRVTTRVYDEPPREIVQVREWRDSTGKFSVQAGFVERKDSQVMLCKATGESIAVPIDRLSEPDQLFLASFGVIDATGLQVQQQRIIESFAEAKVEIVKDAKRPGIPVSEFRFSGPPLESQLAQTKYFPRARKLHIGKNADAKVFQNLRDLRQISELSLQRVTLDQEALNAICQLSTLKKLWLVNTNISDADMGQVNKLRGLDSLSLYGTGIGDRGIEALTDLDDLKYLDLGGTKVTDAGMSKVDFDGLEHLNLSYTKITDAAMSKVASFSKLKSLILQNTEVTEIGLAELQKLEHLEEFNFQSTQVGLDLIIPVLKKVKSLRKVELRPRGGVTQSALQELREVLPEADVVGW